MEELVTIKEAARLLGTTVATMRQWVWKDVVPFVRVRGAIRFRRSELDAWVDAQNKPDIGKGGTP